MLPRSVQKLIDEFSKLPGIGPKSAARLCFYLLSKSQNDIDELGNSVLALNKNLIYCSICYNIAENNLPTELNSVENPRRESVGTCKICADQRRDNTIICVVEEPLDVIALEKTNYQGLYHVLGGVISPIDGIGPEHLRIKQLISRIKNNKSIKEIILALDPSLEGESTSIYISEGIKKLKEKEEIDKLLKITRLARGLPMGGDLEYADEVTLRRSLEGRNSIE